MSGEERVQTEGATYTVSVVGADPAIKCNGEPIAKIHSAVRCNELVRRANALPAVQAQLDAMRLERDEAVELLRQSASDIQASHENYGALFGDDHEQPESPEIVTAIRAFLAKQPTEGGR